MNCGVIPINNSYVNGSYNYNYIAEANPAVNGMLKQYRITQRINVI